MIASPAHIDVDGFTANGCARIDAAVTGDALVALEDALEPQLASGPGARLPEPPRAIMAVAQAGGALHNLAAATSCEPLRPVRVLVFDKRPDANWAVGWHQDRTITVAARHDASHGAPGYSCWSARDGVIHVEPPFALLARMRTVRLHLDDCGGDNGPLEVISGSHMLGRLSNAQINSLTHHSDTTVFTARAGDAIVLALPIIHRSRAAKAPTRRRVLHIDFGPQELPGTPDWAMEPIAS